MNNVTETDRLFSAYEKGIAKDLSEIETDKKKFIKKINDGLGEKIKKFGTEPPKKPSITKIILSRLVRFLKYL